MRAPGPRIAPAGKLKKICADGFENFRERLESGRGFWFEISFHAERMTSAEITFKCSNVIGGIGFVFGGVRLAALASVFFVHPCDYAKSALGMQAELLAEICNLHGDGNSRSVVNCAGAEIPGIEMAADDYDLFGMLGAL